VADAAGGVTRIDLPADARALVALPRLDHVDAWRIDVGAVRRRTAEEWARAFFENAPSSTRQMLRRSWRLLGLPLGPEGSDRHVLGWEVRHRTPDALVLSGRSWYGLRGELLFRREAHHLLFSTCVQQAGPIARAVWAALAAGHVRVVRRVLERGAGRERLE
jgi:hypothetical protein